MLDDWDAYVINKDLHPDLDSPKQAHLYVNGEYYIVSSISHAIYNVEFNETMVFPANAIGEVTIHNEVFVVKPANHEGMIAALLTPDPWADPYYFMHNELSDEDVAHEDQYGD